MLKIANYVHSRWYVEWLMLPLNSYSIRLIENSNYQIVGLYLWFVIVAFEQLSYIELIFPMCLYYNRQITLYLPALTEFIAWARIICLYNMFFPFHLQYILCESGYVYIVSVNFLCRVSRTIGLFVLFDCLVGGYLPKYLYKNNINTNTKENTQ